MHNKPPDDRLEIKDFTLRIGYLGLCPQHSKKLRLAIAAHGMDHLRETVGQMVQGLQNTIERRSAENGFHPTLRCLDAIVRITRRVFKDAGFVPNEDVCMICKIKEVADIAGGVDWDDLLIEENAKLRRKEAVECGELSI